MLSYSTEVLADSPLVYWRLGDASGATATDSSGNSRSGTYANTPTLGVAGLLTGDPDTAVTLNGTSQYVTIAGAAWMNVADYSIEFWVKSNVHGARCMASRDSGTGSVKMWDVSWDQGGTTGKIEFLTFSGTSNTNTLFTVGTYDNNIRHHVVATKSGNTMSLYVDGALENSNTASFTAYNTSTTQGMEVGRRGANTQFYSGTIDEFAFYSGALSLQRIGVHFSAGIGAPYSVVNRTPVLIRAANF